MKNDKLILVAPGKSSFIKLDIAILKKEFFVQQNIYNWQKKILVPLHLFRQFIFMLFNLRTSKAVLIEFAGYWSLIPVIMGRWFRVRTFVVLHGTESSSLPEINYGSLRKPILRWFCKISFQKAYKLLPVSKSLIYTKNTFISEGGAVHQGILHFFPNIKTPHQVVFNGLNIDLWTKEEDIQRKDNTFVTVLGDSQFKRKGGDLMVKFANANPQYTIYFAGATSNCINGPAPENIIFLGQIKQEQLRTLFYQCKYYLQLSLFEGFGLSLCEAMLCKCVPIGSNVNVIPDIIGDAGFIVNNNHLDELETVVKEAQEKDHQSLGILARERITRNYPASKREETLLSLLRNNS